MELKIVKITKENKDLLVEMSLATYIGEKCKYCLHEYTSVEDIRSRNVVYAGSHEHGQTACEECWKANNP